MSAFYRNFKVTNSASQGNCFMFNSKYNYNDTIMYKQDGTEYQTTGRRRQTSLTGPRFGLNLVVTLEGINYMQGEISKQVWFSQYVIPP